MQPVLNIDFRAQLMDRMQRVHAAIEQLGPRPELLNLVHEVEAALERMKDGTFGICEQCHDNIEEDRLLADPLVRFCLDHLSGKEQRALEADLELAGKIQAGLLPERGVDFGQWQVDFFYKAAGIVSGDYCDLIALDDHDGLMFVVGDVAGKGIAASLLATHLHGLFHSLARFQLPVEQLMEHANRLFCESTLASHYATLVCGVTRVNGELELCSAGHFPALFVHSSEVQQIPANTMPLGLFCTLQMETTRLKMAPGDSLLLYTDGVVEAMRDGEEYGIARLASAAHQFHHLAPRAFLNACLEDLRDFVRDAPTQDDVTLMVIRHQ